MRRTLPVLLFIVLALLLASSLAGGSVNAAATQPNESVGATANSRTPVSAERGEQIAREHLAANAAEYGVSAADLAELRLDLNYADDFTGARYVKFVQTVNGIQVFNAVVNVTILPSGEVLFVGNRAVANLAGSVNTATPTLTHAEAIAAAADAYGLTYSPNTLSQLETFAGADREIRFAGGDLSLEYIPVLLAYQPMADGSLRLSWDLNIYQRDAQHWWDVRIDALTGELLDQNDWVVSENWDALLNDPGQVPTGAVPGKMETIVSFADYIVRPQAAPALVGSYRVYQIPIESPSHSTPAGPADGRTLVANPDNATASPFGWHDTNGAAGAEFTTTQGNNAHAYTDTDANNTPDAGSSPDGGAGLVFDFPLDLTQAPSAYRPAAVTNLFYWNNLMHDIPYLYGFDEEARNFQENNYGRGGIGSDYVNAEAQDGSGTNNANFATGADGQNPRMQMYLWTAPNPDRDGDLDNGIIAHEYGHGISNRMTGTGVGCVSNTERMGEGWSDWFSVILTMRAGDTATTNRGVGTYALNQPTNGIGIRPAPYNTNFAVNNYTYANLPSMAVPHGVGFVWNTMLWEMNWELIDAYGWNPDIYDFSAIDDGNILALKLVMDGMAIQPCNPGFVDGRNAILAADVALTGGDNQCMIWEAFARRGLGNSASQGSPNSTTDGTAAFDLPPQCTGGPTPTPTVSPTPGTGNRICNNTAVTIPDNLPAGATSTINVATAGNISDINVVLSATHSFAGDLIFNLSNGATNVTFYDRPGVPTTTFGCGGDNIPGSIADDEGTTGSWENSCGTGTPAFQPGGTYTNNNPLTAFDGQAAAGTWTLTVSDNAAADTGVLNGWCVVVETGTGPTPTATPTVPSTAPDINVTPGAFTEVHATPQTTNDTMNIQNVGSGTLTWTIVEDNSVTPVEDITDKVVIPAQDMRLRAANGSVVASRFLQSGAMAPSVGSINLVVDDGTPEDSIGLTAGGEFVWLNRFTPAPTDFPFTLTSIELLTIGTSGCLPTDTVDFYVYTDADGNPANGATHVGSLTGQLMGTPDQYNTYPTNINVTGSGDVLILAVNRTCDIAGQFPATIDLTASQVRSWVGFGGTPGNPPTLPTTTFGTIDSFGFPGNWTIRGNGSQGGGGCSAPSDIPWLTVSPTNGSTAGGGSTPVTLTYNSASLANGTYTANLCVESNDADEPTVTVPITLTVGGPTAIDLSSFTSPMSGVNLGDFAAAGLLLLAGAILVFRRK